MNVSEYNPGGKHEWWAESEAFRNPYLAEKYFDLLMQMGFLPKDATQADGFVFFSPSANQGAYEAIFAEMVDRMLSEVPAVEHRPLFILADAFGQVEKRAMVDPATQEIVDVEMFTPGFWPGYYEPELQSVVLAKVSADARFGPIASGTVDVIWDRLGALWHMQDARIVGRSLSVDIVTELLASYKRILKEGGSLLVDAGGTATSATVSTADYLAGEFEVEGVDNPAEYALDLGALGWQVRRIGDDALGLLELRPISAEKEA